MNILRPYQQEVFLAVLESVLGRKGLTFCVEIARQGGKNELSAQLEVFLLPRYASESANLVKCSPTFKPQTIISMSRLKERLDDIGFVHMWKAERGYIIQLGKAQAIFMSADRQASVVGHTAHILLEVDEAQDVGREKYTKEFKPMGSTTNCTTVLYGTTWDDSTLLEETKQTGHELEKRDGIKRCFRYDWQDVARYNPQYLAYVETERRRLGENHPLFLTQYCLQPVRGGGGFFSSLQKAQLQGGHLRQHHPEVGKVYVAGIDLAGEAETELPKSSNQIKPGRDSTVVTIGELDYTSVNPLQQQPVVRIVEHYSWTGRHHTGLYPQLVDIIKNVWRCKKVVVDSTGVGQPVAAFLRQSCGPGIVPFVFTQGSKSALGFNLLASINSGLLKMYGGDGSNEYQKFWFEIENSKSFYRPSQTMNFYVEEAHGHDDFLMSLALLVEAANRYHPRIGRGTV